MGQTELATPRGCLELGTQAITDPALRTLRPHQGFNHFGSPTRSDEEIHPHRTPKDPLPPRLPGHARTGLITTDDRTLRHLRANLFSDRLRRGAGPLHKRARPSFAQRHPKEVLTELRDA